MNRWVVIQLTVGRFGFSPISNVTSFHTLTGPFIRALAFSVRDLPKPIAGPISGHKRIVEERWQAFFSDPSQWWDHRSDKGTASYPDFKHKKTQESLWINSKLNPPWVEAELATLEPGTVQESIFSWNRKLATYVKVRQYKKTLELFQKMQGEGMELDRFSFVPVLNACTGLQELDEGRRIHSQITESGYEADAYVGSSLIDMYAKCGCIDDACRVFNKMPKHNVVSWNAIIRGHVKCGQGRRALELSLQMSMEGLEPDPVTYVGLLNACASLQALEEGKNIHGQIIRSGCEFDMYVGSSLIDMYSKCGSIEDAFKVFNKMPTRNVVSWNTMILGLVKCGQGHKALPLSQQMQREGVKPDPITFVGLVNACASIGALEEGMHVHKWIIQSGFESHPFVGNSIVDMYAKCGNIEDAWKAFKKMPTRTLVAWNAMIMGYVKCGEGHKALQLYRQMQKEGLEPDSLTFVGLLNACASTLVLEEGRRIHEQIIESGCECNAFVFSSLVDMYAKCGSTEEAWRVFQKMSSPDVIAWSAMILGFVKCGQGQRALELAQQMQRAEVEPDAGTYVGFLNACASVAALDEGKQFHSQIVQRGYESDVFVANSLVDMYSKCGSLDDARKVFDKMPVRDVVSWTVLLGGYALHGHAKEAIAHFECMCQEGIEINGVTLLSVLSACSRAGLVDEGLEYFQDMCSIHSIPATVEHYAGIADLLGRAGRLHEANDLIKIMCCEPDVTVWMSLLGACRVHGSVEIGENISQQVLKLDSGHAAGYVLLSNIYAAAGHWDGIANVQNQRLENNV